MSCVPLGVALPGDIAVLQEHDNGSGLVMRWFWFSEDDSRR
jgi:hypothetical protein